MRPYESTSDFKMRLRMMQPHNKGMSILGAPKSHPCTVRNKTNNENEITQRERHPQT
jgi:hypothetical protein